MLVSWNKIHPTKTEKWKLIFYLPFLLASERVNCLKNDCFPTNKKKESERLNFPRKEPQKMRNIRGGQFCSALGWVCPAGLIESQNLISWVNYVRIFWFLLLALLLWIKQKSRSQSLSAKISHSTFPSSYNAMCTMLYCNLFLLLLILVTFCNVVFFSDYFPLPSRLKLDSKGIIFVKLPANGFDCLELMRFFITLTHFRIMNQALGKY